MGKTRIATRLGVRAWGAIAIVAVNTVAGIALWQAYDDARGRAEQRTQALAQVYADFAYRSLNTYDQILLDLQGLLGDGVPAEVLAAHLRRQRAQHVNLLNLFVFDRHGAILVGTQDRAADLSDRDYVVVHREDGDAGRYIGRPGVSRLVPGRRFFPMSRRVSAAEGELAGVVAATIDLKDLSDSFDAVRDGAEGAGTAIALVHHDGTLYARSPAALDTVGRKFAVAPLAGDRARTVLSRSPFDDSLRLITQRQVPRYPLVVVASLPHDGVLADWAGTAVPVVAAAAVLSAALLALSAHLGRLKRAGRLLRGELAEARRRAAEARSDLAQAQAATLRAEKLAVLGGLLGGLAREVERPVAQAAVLAAQAKDADGPRAAEAIRQVLAHCHRASDLARSVARVAEDELSEECRRFNLGRYVTDVLMLLRPRFHDTPHRMDVYIPGDIELETVPGAVAQVLTHLVANSLSHGFDDGRSGVIDLAARLDGATVEMVYSDNGKGIPAALHGRVFEPFFSTRREDGCSGLGLGIVHTMVTRVLGGSLTLDSQAGRGVHYTIRFPARQ